MYSPHSTVISMETEAWRGSVTACGGGGGGSGEWGWYQHAGAAALTQNDMQSTAQISCPSQAFSLSLQKKQTNSTLGQWWAGADRVSVDYSKKTCLECFHFTLSTLTPYLSQGILQNPSYTGTHAELGKASILACQSYDRWVEHTNWVYLGYARGKCSWFQLSSIQPISFSAEVKFYSGSDFYVLQF